MLGSISVTQLTSIDLDWTTNWSCSKGPHDKFYTNAACHQLQQAPAACAKLCFEENTSVLVEIQLPKGVRHEVMAEFMVVEERLTPGPCPSRKSHTKQGPAQGAQASAQCQGDPAWQ